MSGDPSLIFLAAMAVAAYLSVRATLDALPQANMLVAALCFLLPTIVFAIVLTHSHHPDVALSLCTSVAVSALLLGTGVSLLSLPPGEATQFDRRWFVVPIAAAALLLAGLRGSAAWLTVLPLLWLAAVAVLLLLPRETLDEKDDSSDIVEVRQPVAWPLLVAGMALVAVTVWVGLEALSQMSIRIRRDDPGILATILLAPTLTLAPIGVGAQWLRAGQSSRVLASMLGVTVGGSLLLPALILLASMLLREPSLVPPRIWRVDAVTLLIASFLLAPSAAGASKAGRPEGLLLVLLYAAYLVASVVAA